jgi:predicted RNA-binding Zn-ribbon protein involved in translation (DUF1610 family)
MMCGGKTIHRLLLLCLLLVAVSNVCAKECSRAVTAEMRANALANAEQHKWAAAAQRAAIASAEARLNQSDDELWKMIPSQSLPRDVHTNKKVGCPNCGDGITPYGNYPWKAAGAWKLQCPNCGEIYPKNDFQAFYESALDEHGFFHRELGDQSLLFNAKHSDPNDPLHKLYVDDGFGLTDEKGRLAIWEARSATSYANAYDLIFDGIQDAPELVAFLSQKAAEHKLGDKSSAEAICRNIEDNLLLEILESVKDDRIHPNAGGRKTCVVTTAIALDRPGVSDEWIDWCFSPEFPDGNSLPWLLTEGIDRDGMGGECGSYGIGWTRLMIDFPGLLSKYPGYTKHDLVVEFPKLKQCFLSSRD